jgi:cation diffusion facilitator family transporter
MEALSPEGMPEHPAAADAGQRSKRRATLAGLLINLPLGLGKIVVGIFGQSQSLVADGVHSLSDLLGDVTVLLAIRYGGRAPDANHPYGHGRFETFATIVVAILLVLTGAGIVLDAVGRLFAPERLGEPGLVPLIVALLSMTLKEGLYWYTIHVARRTGSALIAANAWHHRSDALSSFVAVLGIGGSMAGLVYLDAVAAIVIAAMLVHVAWTHGWPAARELVDTALAQEEMRAIRRELEGVPGVLGSRDLRTRQMGPVAIADVSVSVDPHITISEAHRISEAVRARLVTRFDALTEVVVHVEPAGHAEGYGAHHAPLRDELLHGLTETWRGIPEAESIEAVRLDYLEDGIDVEVVLPLHSVADPDSLRRVLSERAIREIPEIRGLRLSLVT